MKTYQIFLGTSQAFYMSLTSEDKVLTTPYPYKAMLFSSESLISELESGRLDSLNPTISPAVPLAQNKEHYFCVEVETEGAGRKQRVIAGKHFDKESWHKHDPKNLDVTTEECPAEDSKNGKAFLTHWISFNKFSGITFKQLQNLGLTNETISKLLYTDDTLHQMVEGLCNWVMARLGNPQPKGLDDGVRFNPAEVADYCDFLPQELKERLRK